MQASGKHKDQLHPCWIAQHETHRLVLHCRSLRLVLFGFQVLSAGVAFVIGSTQLIAALTNAPKHLPVQEVAQVSIVYATDVCTVGDTMQAESLIFFCWTNTLVRVQYISGFAGPGNRCRRHYSLWVLAQAGS